MKATVSTDELKTLLTESSFGLPKSELGNFSVDDIYLRGRIDRLDQLSTDYLGAIDYKSSAHSFKLQEAYDGLSLQFMTYLDVIKQAFPNQKSGVHFIYNLKTNRLTYQKLISCRKLLTF